MRQLKIVQSITSRESDSITEYLNEINKYPLLTTDEEVELAQQIHMGNKQALDKLVCSNLRFVVSVAKQYQTLGMKLPDLINEGNLGLIRAAERFDETRGFKFISYAVWWIRQSILQATADTSRMVRLPLNQVGLLQKLQKAASAFEQEYERKPSMAEIAERVDIPEDKVREVLSMSGQPRSMDAPLAEGEESSLVDVLANTDIPNTDHTLISESLATQVNQILSTIDERSANILRMYYGIGGPVMTLDEIASEVGLTRERVRQIKETTVRKLGTTRNKKILREYLG